MAKRKTLPKEFEDLLKDGDFAKLIAVFETCDLDARGGLWKRPALAFEDCPDDLARWLVEHGADLEAADGGGKTPLQARSGSWRGRIGILLSLGAEVNHGDDAGTALHIAAGALHPDNVRPLLAHGARVDARDKNGMTPLEYALQRCSNTGIAKMAEVADLLLEAGASRSRRMQDFVTRIGTNFEFHRSNYNSDSRAAASDGLDRLYALFDVPPAPRRVMHDGVAPIIASASRWQGAHQELWDLLVPSSGPAQTVQGEVIRVSGRIAREIDGNGAVNWNTQFRLMADAWLSFVRSGTPLPDADEAAALIAEIKRRDGDTRRMMELGVAWVALNPEPVSLSPPAYTL